MRPRSGVRLWLGYLVLAAGVAGCWMGSIDTPVLTDEGFGHGSHAPGSAERPPSPPDYLKTATGSMFPGLS